MFSVGFLSVQCDHYSWRNRFVPSLLPGVTGIGSPWLQSSRHQTCLPRTSHIKDCPGHQTCAPPHVAPFSLALPPATDIWWPSLDTFSKLYTWGLPRWYWHLVAIEARTVGKRAVRILLECFLVLCFSVVYKLRFSRIHSSTDLNSNFY